MKASRFAKDTIIILVIRIGNLAVSVVFSILLANLLGPEGKGTYSLVLLFSSLFVTFLNFGLGPATVYLTAKGEYSPKTVLENGSVVILILGLMGVLLGILLLSLTGQLIYPEIPRQLLYLSLLLIPLNLFFSHLIIQYLLGANKLGLYNISSFGIRFIPLVFFLLAILISGPEISAVLWSRIFALIVLAGVLYFLLRRSVGGISLSLNKAYLKDAYQYGIRAYFGNVIGFLNYRIELFLLGFFLPLSEVGFYSVAVGLAEMLWLVSQSAGTLIFPMISAEKDEDQKKYFTPLVARTVMGVTFLAAIVLFFLVDWLIPLVYRNQFNPSIPLFKILLPGIVFISASRVLANDIAGRGKPILNTYIGGAGFLVQLITNLSLIPIMGAVGAAWASSIAYFLLLAFRLVVYVRVSGNTMRSVILPHAKDWEVYRLLFEKGFAYIKDKITKATNRQ